MFVVNFLLPVEVPYGWYSFVTLPWALPYFLFSFVAVAFEPLAIAKACVLRPASCVLHHAELKRGTMALKQQL